MTAKEMEQKLTTLKAKEAATAELNKAKAKLNALKTKKKTGGKK